MKKLAKLISYFWRLLKAIEVRPELSNPKIVWLELERYRNIRTLRLFAVHFGVAGHKVYIRVRPSRRVFELGSCIHWHTNIRLVLLKRSRIQGGIIFTDTPSSYESYRSVNPISVEYSYGPHVHYDETRIGLPYTMHSQIYTQYFDHRNLLPYRNRARSIRLLFVGNHSSDYDSEEIESICGLLGRHRVIKHIADTFEVELIQDQNTLQRILTGEIVAQTVVCTCRVDQKNWLQLLSTADFFLALPGIVHPLAHNLIEAMAVGTIPVTNYFNWLTPPLSHALNSITFTDLDTLDKRLEEIFHLEDREILELRQGVTEYYEKNLLSYSFIERLMKLPPKSFLHVPDEDPITLREYMC